MVSVDHKRDITSVTIAARGSYHYGKHFLKIDALDLYAGPSWISVSSSIDGNSGFYNGSYAMCYWGTSWCEILL